MWGNTDQGESIVVRELLGMYIHVRTSDPEMVIYHPRVRLDIGHEPQPQVKLVGVCPPPGEECIRRVSVFIPGLLEL